MRFSVRFAENSASFKPATFAESKASFTPVFVAESRASFTPAIFAEGNTAITKASFEESKANFAPPFKEMQVITQTAGDLQYYEGEYKITPSAHDETVMRTAKKLMKTDVTVQKIPYYDVDNMAGGSTVYIASEV